MMKKRYLLIVFLITVSCSTSKVSNKPIEIKTLIRPNFEVKYMSNWFIGKLKSKDTISAVVISKKKKSFSPLLIIESNYFILKKDLSLKELVRFILENDADLRNDKELKFRVSENYVEAIGVWKYDNGARKKKIRYYKHNNSILKAVYNSSIRHFNENEKEKKLFFGSLKFK